MELQVLMSNIDMNFTKTFIWLAIGIIMLAVEIGTLSMVSLWFCVGAVVTSIVSIFCDSLLVQVITFIVISAVTFFVFRKFYKKRIKTVDVSYSVVGKTGTTKTEVTPFEGMVEVDGIYWKAKSKYVIEKDNIVKIVDAERNTVMIERYTEE